MASGLQRDSEKSWFAELSDKGIKLTQKSKLSCVCIYLIDKGLLSTVKIPNAKMADILIFFCLHSNWPSSLVLENEDKRILKCQPFSHWVYEPTVFYFPYKVL